MLLTLTLPTIYCCCCLSIVVYHVTDSDVASASCVKKGEGEGIHVTHLDIVHRSLMLYVESRYHSSVVSCHIADSDVASVSCVKKGKGEGSHAAHLN